MTQEKRVSANEKPTVTKLISMIAGGVVSGTISTSHCDAIFLGGHYVIRAIDKKGVGATVISFLLAFVIRKIPVTIRSSIRQVLEIVKPEFN
jgi:hypothetical protein